MKIAVLGASVGSHFLSKRLLEDSSVEKVYHIGANIALQPTSRYNPINSTSNNDVIKFLETTELDLVVLNTIDFLRKKRIQEKIIELGLPSCSTTFDLAKLEWSKIKGKKLLNSLGIPTPKSEIIDLNTLLDKFKTIPRPFVVKFEEDWRAGLQTLIITDENVDLEYNDLLEHGSKRFSKLFGDFVDQKLTLEQYIPGKREYSYHAICNETGWRYLGSARDYKKFEEGDRGFNTAGMGSYSPVNINPIVHEYMDKIFNKLKENGTPYRGIIYLGIMEDTDGTPYVLEINTRPGDPEFQSILLTHKTNISKILHQVATNQNIDEIEFNNQHGVAVRIVNSSYRKIINLMHNNEIDKLEHQINPNLWPEIPGRYISYHKERKLLNSVIASTGETREQASDSIFKFLKNIDMYNYTYRKDVGYLE